MLSSTDTNVAKGKVRVAYQNDGDNAVLLEFLQKLDLLQSTMDRQTFHVIHMVLGTPWIFADLLHRHHVVQGLVKFFRDVSVVQFLVHE